MDIHELKRRKKALGYTNADIALRSGIPLGTVQKVFSGATGNPRIATVTAIERVLNECADYEHPAECGTGTSPLKDSMHENSDDDGAETSLLRESPPGYSIDEGAGTSLLRESVSEYTAIDNSSISEYDRNMAGKIPARRVDPWLSEHPSKRWPGQGQYTLADYYDLPSDVRAELIDGVIYDMSSPTDIHQRIIGELYYALYRCIEDNDEDCEIILSPYDVRLDMDSRTMVQPDLMVTCHANANLSGTYLEGPPDLALEVLSPSTRVKDCTVKLRKYMNAGVREYWIVDPEQERVLVYVFDRDVLPMQYSFDDEIPVAISGCGCIVDMGRINARLKKLADR